MARGSQGLIPITEVRKAAELPKVVFDALALRLMREGKLTMHEHDFPESLSDARRAGLVEGPKGRVFVGMALPPGQDLGSKVLAKAKLYGPGAAGRIASLRKDLSLSPTEFDIAPGALQRLGKVALYQVDSTPEFPLAGF